MTVRDDLPVLGADSLNRATLARQGLLDRVDVDPVTALETFGGLQAQEPASPYLALWTRLRSFEAADLERAFHERRAVKATLMRITLHAVSSRDYRLAAAGAPSHASRAAASWLGGPAGSPGSRRWSKRSRRSRRRRAATPRSVSCSAACSKDWSPMTSGGWSGASRRWSTSRMACRGRSGGGR